MSNARLVKRKEVTESQQVDFPRAPQPPPAQPITNAVMEWVNDRQHTKRLSPHEAFAALFAQPHAD